MYDVLNDILQWTDKLWNRSQEDSGLQHLNKNNKWDLSKYKECLGKGFIKLFKVFNMLTNLSQLSKFPCLLKLLNY